jgi:hypothetical protein
VNVAGVSPSDGGPGALGDWLADELGPAGASVYVIEATHATKVGMTRLGIDPRLNDLKRATGMVELEPRGLWHFGKPIHARRVERGAHWLLRESRTIGEWFACPWPEAVAAVEEVIALGIPLEAEHSPEDAAAITAWRAAR